MRERMYLMIGVPVVLLLLALHVGCKQSAEPTPAAGTASTETTPPASTGTATPPTPATPPGTAPIPSSMRRSTLADLAQLGVVGEPSKNPRGLLVKDFLPSATPWPLQVIGVQKGDVVISCNGQAGQLGARILQALEGLQNRGEAITLVVVRDGKDVTLSRSEKLP